MIKYNLIKKFNGNNLKRRYTIALGLIAFLIILSQIVVQSFIHNLEKDSNIINIAGSQAMLSQKICKVVLKIHSTEDKTITQAYIKELDYSLKLFIKSNKYLESGDLSYTNSSIVKSLFKKLKPYYLNITTTSTNILTLLYKNEQGTNEEYLSNYAKLLDNENKFLEIMNAITFQYV